MTRKLQLQETIASRCRKSKILNWQKTEACLGEIITVLGGKYNPSSSGTQGGFDGIAIFKLENTDYLWKLESKSNTKEYEKWIGEKVKQLQNIKLEDFAGKIIDMLSQDKMKWPIVFCLFSPHRIKDAQMQDKIRNLERNYRIPFKISFWDYDYLKEKIPCVLSKKSLNLLYPEMKVSYSKNKRSYIVNEFLGDIRQDSLKGISISNRYIGVQDQSLFSKEINIRIRREKINQNKEGYIFEYLGNKTTQLVELKEVDACCLGKLPMTKTALPHKSVVNFLSYNEEATITSTFGSSIKTVESVDSEKYNVKIAEKRKQLIKLMQDKIVFKNIGSLYDLIREKASESLLVNINPEKKDNILVNLPFKFLDKEDFAANIDLLSFRIFTND